MTRVELPNVNALAVVIRAETAAPPEHLGEYLRSRDAELPQELYWSSALRTSAT